MNSLIQKAIAFTVLAISLGAHAGREGNGGDVVYCGQPAEMLRRYPELGTHVPGRPFVGLLDVVEGRVLRNYLMDLGPAPVPGTRRPTLTDLMPKIEIVLGRIGKFDPRRERLYRSWALSFFNEAKIDQIELVDIPDSNHKGVPVGCTPKQLIIHEEPQFEDEPRYIINSIYWDQMDANHQVAAMFHEFAYREGISLGHSDSRPARYYNSSILSNKFGNLTMASYLKLIKQTKLIGGEEGIAWVNGEEYSVSAKNSDILEVDADAQVIRGCPIRPKTLHLGSLVLKVKNDTCFTLGQEQRSLIPEAGTTAILGGVRITLSGDEILILDGQNRILKGGLQGYQLFPTAYGAVEFIGEFVADPQGRLKGGYAWWKGGTLEMADGRKWPLKQGLYQVYLDEQGRFKNASFWTAERSK